MYHIIYQEWEKLMLSLKLICLKSWRLNKLDCIQACFIECAIGFNLVKLFC